MKKPELFCPDRNAVTLRRAILLYGSGIDSFATSHPIEIEAGQPVIGVGRGIRQEDARMFGRILAGDRARAGGFVNERVVYLTQDAMGWWRPAGKATIFFGQAISKGVSSTGTIAQPPLFFVITRRRWFVFALYVDRRPGPETVLCHAPYYNVYDDGHICEGDLKRPEALNPAAIMDHERAFFNSRFTHPNAKDLTVTPLPALWTRLLTTPPSEFPREELKSMTDQGDKRPLTLATLMQRLDLADDTGAFIDPTQFDEEDN
jgi:PRTRC genetic system protein B